jgi:hypothetical protein
MKWAGVLMSAAVACGTTDDRPETLAYITETILAPSCAAAECHSAVKRQSNYVFDTVAHAQASIASLPLIDTCPTPPCPRATLENSYLLTVITTEDSAGHRMPLDQPLANLDIVLISDWIRDGAAGYVPP